MIQKYKKNVNKYIGLGFLLSIGGACSKDTTFMLIGIAAGLAFYVAGCAQYAKAKGYHGAWGLLGLLRLFGLLILVCMKDRHKNG